MKGRREPPLLSCAPTLGHNALNGYEIALDDKRRPAVGLACVVNRRCGTRPDAPPSTAAPGRRCSTPTRSPCSRPRTGAAGPSRARRSPSSRRPSPRPLAGTSPNAAASRASDAKVDAGEQRARDSDARKILDAELKREEAKLAELQKEFNNGEPERRGDERNYQKYLDRVAEMKAAIARKQSDVAALKRELAKLPPPKE